MRVLTLCLAVSLLAPITSESADGKEGSGPWIATAGIIRDGGQSGSGVYLKSGLVITAALIGIMSRKFTSHMPEGDRDTAKYFVPAAAIREFLPAEFSP
jgi:hypothetical protein